MWYTVFMWTKERIAHLLRTSDRAVERAMVAIYDRQTQDEKQVSDTRHTNRRGFTAAHAKRGSYFARWVLGGRRLSGHHLDRARQIALHYTAQLAEVANVKAQRELPFERTSRREPPPGSWAATARFLAESGIMTGDEADAWKDEMKERAWDEPGQAQFEGE